MIGSRRSRWVSGIGSVVLVGGWLLASCGRDDSPSVAQRVPVDLSSIIQNLDKALPAAQRFVILSAFNNDAVLDKKTGLVWEKSPQTTTVTWNVARTTCAPKAVGGQKGWRLPSPAELRSLLGPFADSTGPTLPPGHPFLNVQSTSYWSVVPEANLPSYARYVDAFLGNVLSLFKMFSFPVWCVLGPMNADQY